MVQTAGVVTFPIGTFGTSRGSVLLGVGGNIVTVTSPGSMFIQNIGTIVGPREMHLHIDGTIVMLLDPAPVLVPVGTTTGGGSTGGTTGGADAYYRHPQLNAAAIWYVTHNLNKHPAVSLEDLNGNEVWSNVIYTSNNTLEVHFTNPFAGYANCS